MQRLADTPRAFRYEMSAPVLYRSAGDVEWLEGLTVNVSRSGVLFHSKAPALAAETRVDLLLLLPGLGLPGSARVQCRGRIVRQGGEPAGGGVAMAATIDSYDFLGTAPQAAAAAEES